MGIDCKYSNVTTEGCLLQAQYSAPVLFFLLKNLRSGYLSPLVVHQFHLVVRQATKLEKEDAAFQDKYLAFFFFFSTHLASMLSLILVYEVH